MPRTGNNSKSLTRAGVAKKDDFFTQLTDIEEEVKHYREHFKNASVLCNCDDPSVSNFYKYFMLNFEFLGLRKLVGVCYKNSRYDMFSEFQDRYSVCLEYNGRAAEQPIKTTILSGDGDFRSEECKELLRHADIVVTNPPFSLFREYIAQLIEFNKKFLIIGNVNAVTYKEVFPLFKNNQIWFGASIHSGDREFEVPKDYPLYASGCRVDESTGRKYIRVKGVRWFTNLDYPQLHEDLILYKTYSPEEYPHYDNYDAINVDKTADIPMDYAPCWFTCTKAANCQWAQHKGRNAEMNDLCDEEDVYRTEQNRTEQNRTSRGVEMASLECQSPLSTDTTPTNLKSLATSTPLQLIRDAAMSTERECIHESLLSGKCNGVMGVPITFLDRFNPDQFEIVGMAKRGAGDPMLKTKVYTREDYPNYSDLNATPTLFDANGVLHNTYPRILIRRKY